MADDLNVNPTTGEQIMRSKQRIPRLKQAIAKEKAKATPDLERVTSLQAELDRRTNQIKTFMEGIE